MGSELCIAISKIESAQKADSDVETCLVNSYSAKFLKSH